VVRICPISNWENVRSQKKWKIEGKFDQNFNLNSSRDLRRNLSFSFGGFRVGSIFSGNCHVNNSNAQQHVNIPILQKHIRHFPLKMLYPQNPLNRETQIPPYLAVHNQIENFDEFEFAPRNLVFSMWWISGGECYQWNLSYQHTYTPKARQHATPQQIQHINIIINSHLDIIDEPWRFGKGHKPLFVVDVQVTVFLRQTFKPTESHLFLSRFQD